VQAWIQQKACVDVECSCFFVRKGWVVARHGHCGECVVVGDNVWAAALEGVLPTKGETALVRILACVFVVCVVADVVRLFM
jgi:hypothetical protein